MKFLKALLNSFLCGLFFSLLLSLLFADLNINLALSVGFLGRLTLSLAMVYGFALTFVALLLFFVIQFFGGKKAQIAAVSPSFLSLSFSLLILLFLAIFRANLHMFSSLFDLKMRSFLQTQQIVLFLLVFLGFALFYAFHSYRKKPFFFIAYFLILGAALAFVFSLRWNYRPPPAASKLTSLESKQVDKKVIIIGMEGLSFDFIIPLVSDGKLPNFSWLMEQGSWGRLQTFSPNESFVLETSFETGKFPAKHRHLSNSEYQFLKMRQTLEVVPRYILFKQLKRIGLLKILPREPAKTAKDIWDIFADNKISFIKKNEPDRPNVSKPGPKAEKLFSTLFKDTELETGSIISYVRNAFYNDFDYEEKAMQEKTEAHPQVFYLMLDGLNIVEAFFYKYSFPHQFGSIDQESLTKYGSVIERYYNFYDQLIGKYLTALKEDEILIVYSPQGIEALPLWKRFLEMVLGNSLISAHHEFRPDGVIFFYGKGIVRGKNVEGMRLIDIIPTLLYALGLPVGKDMDGIVRSQLFIQDFIAENPIFYISSYEEVQIKPPR